MKFAATFEKNRKALLRLVCFWLVVARGVQCVRAVLPKRLSRYTATMLFKMEAATGFLILSVGLDKKRNGGKSGVFLRAAQSYAAGLPLPKTKDILTLDEVINRLKALLMALRGLACANARKCLGLQLKTLREAIRRSTQSTVGLILQPSVHLELPP